jgi:hypothetical protein
LKVQGIIWALKVLLKSERKQIKNNQRFIILATMNIINNSLKCIIKIARVTLINNKNELFVKNPG